MSEQNVKGFIIDAPNVLVKSKKGDYQNLTATTGEVTFAGDTLKINGGQSFYELAELDKSKTIALKATDAQLNLKSLAVTGGGTITKGTSAYEFFGEIYQVDGTGTFIIPKAILANSLRVNDYTETTGTVGEGQFKVTISSASTTVQLPSSDADTKVTPSYQVTLANITTLSTKTTDFPKSGEITLEWPIYSDSEAAESDIIGYAQLVIFKAKILQSFKMGGNYKTASTFDFTANGLDPRRPDGKMWDLRFREENVAVDTTPLTIVSVLPVDKATAVVATSPIVFTFSKAINSEKVNAANFMVIDSTDGTSPAGTFVISTDKTQVTFDPTASLITAMKYIVTVNANVEDLIGNSLGANHTTIFTVA